MSSAPDRPKRRNYSVVGKRKRQQETGCFTALLLCGVLFLVGAVTAIVLLLSASDLTLPASTDTNKLVGSVECNTDEDCRDCCHETLRGGGNAPLAVSLNPCLLPPNTTHHVCVNHCCVPPPPLHAPDNTPCDDGKWCSMQDRCQQGSCVGSTRECQDSDFCTAEECSETLQMCVSGNLRNDPDCENQCEIDDDCRTDFYCLPSKRCGRFPDVNGTMLFTGYEMERCKLLEGNAFAMVQHYTLFEKVYERDLEQRFRHASEVVLPKANSYDKHQLEYSPHPDGIPLVDVVEFSDSRLHSFGNASYSQTSVTLRTACQEIFPDDQDICLSMWANRQYDFEVAFKDCALDQDSVLTKNHDSCLPGDIWRGYTMSLSVLHCPTGKTVQIEELTWLTVTLASSPNTPQTVYNPRDRVRVVWESDSGVYLDPFLTDVTVCMVNTEHRLSECALNNPHATNCPYRGCNGWSDYDSPLVHRRNYLKNSIVTADASLHDVTFCRQKSLYVEGGCAAGVCAWSQEPERSAYGGADGFEFTLYEEHNAVIVIDVSVRHALCDVERSSSDSTNYYITRKVGVARVE